MLGCTSNLHSWPKLNLQINQAVYKCKFRHSAGHFLASSASRSQDRTLSDLIVQQEMNAARRLIRGVIFDMDGTLIVPVIDFAEMRCADLSSHIPAFLRDVSLEMQIRNVCAGVALTYQRGTSWT